MNHWRPSDSLVSFQRSGGVSGKLNFVGKKIPGKQSCFILIFCIKKKFNDHTIKLHLFINLFMNQYIYIFIYLLIYSLFLYFLKNSIKKKSLLSLIELYFYFFISSFIDQLFLSILSYYVHFY